MTRVMHASSRVPFVALWRVLLVSLIGPAVHAQDPARFAEEIAVFTGQDKAHAPPVKPVLFVGSSSIRLWTNLTADFPQYPVLNRGFGGSHLSDVNALFDQVVLPYHPRAIILYAGDNDIASGKTASIVRADFDTFIAKVHAQLGAIPVAFIEIKPSPSRRQFMTTQREANRLIEEKARQSQNLAVIKVFDAMLDAKGEPRTELFINDQLHLNAKGYALWRTIVNDYLAGHVAPGSGANP
jgi:lysophospholipase L1-like esterase